MVLALTACQAAGVIRESLSVLGEEGSTLMTMRSVVFSKVFTA